jgi:hypothetical protein
VTTPEFKPLPHQKKKKMKEGRKKERREGRREAKRKEGRKEERKLHCDLQLLREGEKGNRAGSKASSRGHWPGRVCAQKTFHIWAIWFPKEVVGNQRDRGHHYCAAVPRPSKTDNSRSQ